MNRSVSALVAREVQLDLAEKLVFEAGHTLSSLQQTQGADLAKLGLSQNCIEAIHGGPRPPIPNNTLIQLLVESKRTCCVCHDFRRPIVIHHIQPWTESRSHDEENLIVLCPNCHAAAHTRSELTINLGPDELRAHKFNWYAEVKSNTRDSVLRNIVGGSSGFIWDCFNHSRLIDVAQAYGIDISLLDSFNELLDSEKILPSGEPNINSLEAEPINLNYLYDGFSGGFDRRLLGFYSRLLSKILEVSEPTYISDEVVLSDTIGELRENSIIIVRGSWRYKREHSENHNGPNLTRSAKLKLAGMEFSYNFDAWESTSSSALHHHLKGYWPSVSILLVRSADGNSGRVGCTLLATGTSNGWSI